MDNQKNTILWDGQETQEAPLRRPREVPNVTNALGNLSLDSNNSNNEPVSSSLQVQTENIQNNLANIISHSTLSADAVEWYPANFRQVSSIQSRLSRVKVHEPEQNEQEQETDDADANYTCDVAINITRMKEIINAITYDPGQFETLVDAFLEIVTPHFQDVDTVDTLADMIFDQAMCEASFRYNAARLCNILQEQCALFRPRLYILCEKGVHNDTNISGLTYFLAELYTQKHVQSMYGICLLDAMKNLIAKQDPDGFKCVCQTLKLSGYYLDVEHKATVDEIFNLLESQMNIVPGNLKNLHKSVVELRANNWGHSTAQPSTNGYQELNGFLPNSQDNDIFENGPDMSAEEHEFLSSCEEYNDYLNGDYDPDDLCNPEPEMDEEIRAAFREFVQFSKR